jgi:hypothetical protein
MDSQMNIEAAMVLSQNHPVVAKLAELAVAAGGDADFNVRMDAFEQRLKSVKIVTSEEFHVEASIAPDGFVDVSAWIGAGRDFEAFTASSLDNFNTAVDDKITELSASAFRM